MEVKMSWISNIINGVFHGGWVPMPKPTPTPVPTPVVPPLTGLDDTLLKLHNAQRSANSPLKINAQLDVAAVKHAQWMASNRNMSHFEGSKSVADRAKAAGYNWSYVGENIAEGYTDANAVFKGWMGSMGHRANILNRNYQDVGFGAAKDANGAIYWRAVFGRSGN
jgi:uncharacterized protein YkwD